MRSSVAWFVAVALLIGCSRATEQADDITPAAETVIHVRNDRFLDMTVYLLRGAARTRLGTVRGHSSETFLLPRHLVAGLTELRFLVDPIGARGSETSETIVAQPGDIIEVRIGPK
jgi:hypothetical protein